MSLYTSEKEAKEAELKKLQDSGASVNGAVINAFYFVDTLPASPLFPANVIVERAMAAQATADKFNVHVCGMTCTVSYKDGQYVKHEIAAQDFVFDEDDAKLFQEGAYPIYRDIQEALETLIQADLQTMQPGNWTVEKTHKFFCFFDPLPDNAVLPGAFKVQKLAFKAPDEYEPAIQGCALDIVYSGGKVQSVDEGDFIIDDATVGAFKEDKVCLFASREAMQDYYVEKVSSQEYVQQGKEGTVKCRGFYLARLPPSNLLLPQSVTISRAGLVVERDVIVAGGANYFDREWQGFSTQNWQTLGFKFDKSLYLGKDGVDITYAFDMMAPPALNLQDKYPIQPHLQGSGFIGYSRVNNEQGVVAKLQDANRSNSFPLVTEVPVYEYVKVYGTLKSGYQINGMLYNTPTALAEIAAQNKNPFYIFIPGYIAYGLETVSLDVKVQTDCYNSFDQPIFSQTLTAAYNPREQAEAELYVEIQLQMKTTPDGVIGNFEFCATWVDPATGETEFTKENQGSISINDYCRLMTMASNVQRDYAQVIMKATVFGGNDSSTFISCPIMMNLSALMFPPAQGTLVPALKCDRPFCTYPPLQGAKLYQVRQEAAVTTSFDTETGLYVLPLSVFGRSRRVKASVKLHVIVITPSGRGQQFMDMLNNGTFLLTVRVQTVTTDGTNLDGGTVTIAHWSEWPLGSGKWVDVYEHQLTTNEYNILQRRQASEQDVLQLKCDLGDDVPEPWLGPGDIVPDQGESRAIQARGLVQVKCTQQMADMEGFEVFCLPYYSLYIE